MTRVRRPSPQTVAVLDALAARASEWSHGYDLSRSQGLKAGTVYPILIRLAERGFVEAAWEQGRPAGAVRPAFTSTDCRLPEPSRCASCGTTQRSTAPAGHRWSGARRLAAERSQGHSCEPRHPADTHPPPGHPSDGVACCRSRPGCPRGLGLG